MRILFCPHPYAEKGFGESGRTIHEEMEDFNNGIEWDTDMACNNVDCCLRYVGYYSYFVGCNCSGARYTNSDLFVAITGCYSVVTHGV
jgi:hypothetical protein